MSYFYSKQPDIEFVYYYSPDGVQYPLFGGKRALMRFSGLEMPEINYLQDSGPFVHGTRIRDFRLGTRILEFTQFERGLSRQDRWDNLGEMISTMRPNRGGSGRVLVVLPNGTEREIDAWILEGPAGEYVGDASLSPWDLDETIRFICPFPVWRDPNENSALFTISLSDSCLPTCLPSCLGFGIINTSIDITYPGTWESKPTIVLTGPIAEPIVRNETTNEQITLNYVAVAGETIYIELTPDSALVYNNFGTNLIGTVTDSNDLSAFSIDPVGLDVPDGINEIIIAASGGVAGLTSIELNYYDRYLGVPL